MKKLARILVVMLMSALLMCEVTAPVSFAATKKTTGTKTTVTTKNMTCSATASCKNKNHVGNDWTKEFYINGKAVKASSKIQLKVGDKVTVKCKMTERDKYPDVGSKSATHKVTADDIKKGFTLKLDVTVKENKGRYSGNKCTWNVAFKFK